MNNSEVSLNYLAQINPKVELPSIGDIEYLPMENVHQGSFEHRSGEISSLPSSLNAFCDGDILLAKVTPCFENGNICLAKDLKNGMGLCSTELFVLRPNKKLIMPEFLLLLLQDERFRQEAQAYMRGTGGLKRIPPDFLTHYKFIVPSFEVQGRIVSNVHKFTEIIYRTIKCKNKILNELMDYKESLITRAVTKGLDPNVPMKDSGIPWIGKVPEHWKLSKIKWEFKNFDKERIPIEETKREKGNIPYYGASGIIDYVNNYIFDDDLLLIGEDGANLRFRNLPLVYRAIGKSWINNHAHIIKPYRGIIDYYFYSIELTDLTIYLSGMAQPKLTRQALDNIPIVVPPIQEQKAIADYCIELDHRFQRLKENLQRQIKSLKEYRSSLISKIINET